MSRYGAWAAALLAATAIFAAVTIGRAGAQQAAPSNMVSSTSPMPAPEGARVLSADTGKVAGRSNVQGGGHSVKCRVPEGQWYLVAVDFCAARYGQGPGGGQWQLAVCEDNNRTIATILEPYGAIQTGDARWYRVSLPPLALPTVDAGHVGFLLNLAFNSSKAGGVEVCFDAPKKASSSATGMPDGDLKKMAQGGDWIVRAVVTETPEKSRPELGKWLGPLVELKYDNGNWRGTWDKQGASPTVRFTDVPANSVIEGVSVYAAQPPRVDPTRRKAEWWVIDESGNVLASGSLPYTSFPTDLGWVDVPMKTRLTAPASFYFVADGNPDARGGIQFAYDEKLQLSDHAMLASAPGKYVPVKEKRDWMIRAYVRKPAPVYEETAGTADTSGDGAAAQ